MTKKQAYWLADGYGGKALVEGVDQKDRWVPLGWSESDEPAGEDRVWMRHPDVQDPAQFPAAAVELWRQKGWEPGAPPEPINPFNAAAPADVVAHATVATPTTSPAPAGKASDATKER